MIVEARTEIMAKTKIFARELWKQSLVLYDRDFMVVWQGGEPGYQEKRWEDTSEGRDDNVEMKKFVQQISIVWLWMSRWTGLAFEYKGGLRSRYGGEYITMRFCAL